MRSINGLIYAVIEKLSGRRTIDTMPAKYLPGIARLRLAYSDDYLTAQLHGGPDYEAIGKATGALSEVPDATLGATDDERITTIRELVNQLKRPHPAS